MNYYSNWSYDSPHRRWEEVCESQHRQQIKTIDDATRFISAPPIKEPLLYYHIEPKQENIFTSTTSRPTEERQAKPTKKPGFWQRLGRIFL